MVTYRKLSMKKQKQNSYSIPSEYEYMDTLDIDGWQWEFMRRNPFFRSDYKSVKELNEYRYNPEWWELGERYSMTADARKYFNLLDPSRTYPEIPDKLKPVFEEKVPIKSLHREELLKEIRKTLKYWSYIEKDNPLWKLEVNEFILQAVEMSIRPGMFPRNVEYMGINLDASRTELRAAFEKFLKNHIREKRSKGDEKQYFGAHKTALMVWDLRAQRKTFPDIQKTTGIDKNTVKKKFYRAYELIYRKKYNPADYEHPPIREKYIKRHCRTCEQRPTCKELCPDVIGYVDQDNMGYQREMTFGDMDILTKAAKGIPEEYDTDTE